MSTTTTSTRHLIVTTTVIVVGIILLAWLGTEVLATVTDQLKAGGGQ